MVVLRAQAALILRTRASLNQQEGHRDPDKEGLVGALASKGVKQQLLLGIPLASSTSVHRRQWPVDAAVCSYLQLSLRKFPSHV